MARTQFTKAEADELLGRAARLQTETERARADAPLSLDDLKDAAAAAGIDPSFVDLAALAPVATAPAPVLSVATGVARSRLVPGTLTPAQWHRLVSDLRNTLGGKGRVEDGPYRYGWHRAPLAIEAVPQGEYVQLTARANWGAEVRGWGTLVAAVVFTLGAAFGRPFGAPVALVVGALAALLLVPLLLRPRFRAKEQRVGAKFDAALDRIAATIASADAAQLPVREAVAPVLTLPEEVADEAVALPPAARRTHA